jgi:hypothetical protein
VWCAVMLLCYAMNKFYDFVIISVKSQKTELGIFVICYRRTRKCAKENFPEMG